MHTEDRTPMFQRAGIKTRFPIHFRFSQFYRRRRMEFFLTHFRIRGDEKILDAGGESYFWESVPQISDLTLLNTFEEPSSISAKIVVYPGGPFPFSDREFDIVFSNSTIEHVGGWADRELFASEIRRCGKGYFVQTPSFWFPYDPHALIPFFQFLPSALKKRIHRLFPRSPYPIQDLLSIRLLTKRKIRRLFPGARIVTERFLVFPKSYYAMDR